VVHLHQGPPLISSAPLSLTHCTRNATELGRSTAPRPGRGRSEPEATREKLGEQLASSDRASAFDALTTVAARQVRGADAASITTYRNNQQPDELFDLSDTDGPQAGLTTVSILPLR
jgi:hypothetical protein